MTTAPLSPAKADPQLVRTLRAQVADRLNQQRRSDEVAGRATMSPEDERQFAHALIVQVLEDHARAEITLGRSPLSAAEEEAIAAAIHAALFGVGRLQPLLQDPEVHRRQVFQVDQVQPWVLLNGLQALVIGRLGLIADEQAWLLAFGGQLGEARLG